MDQLYPNQEVAREVICFIWRAWANEMTVQEDTDKQPFIAPQSYSLTSMDEEYLKFRGIKYNTSADVSSRLILGQKNTPVKIFKVYETQDDIYSERIGIIEIVPFSNDTLNKYSNEQINIILFMDEIFNLGDLSIESVFDFVIDVFSIICNITWDEMRDALINAESLESRIACPLIPLGSVYYALCLLNDLLDRTSKEERDVDAEMEDFIDKILMSRVENDKIDLLDTRARKIVSRVKDIINTTNPLDGAGFEDNRKKVFCSYLLTTFFNND